MITRRSILSTILNDDNRAFLLIWFWLQLIGGLMMVVHP